MTLLYTHHHSIHQYDRGCADHLLSPAYPPRSTSAFQSIRKPMPVDAIPRIRPPTPADRQIGSPARTDKCHQEPSILAPCPKKPSYNYQSHFLAAFNAAAAAAHNTGHVMYLESPWGLEDIREEDTYNMMPEVFDKHNAYSRPYSNDAAACSELLEILGNSSRGSSCSVSQSSSPSPMLSAPLSPSFQLNGERYEDSGDDDDDDDDDVLVEEHVSPSASTAALDIKRTPGSMQSRLTLPTLLDQFEATAQKQQAFFGSSPITRAHNPLPLDSTFSPSQRRAQRNSNPPQLAAFQRNLCEAVSELHVAAPEPSVQQQHDESAQGPAKKLAALLRVPENGGRPRSLSVGSVNNKRGSKVLAF